MYKACGPATVATCMAGELRVQQARKVKAFATSLKPLCSDGISKIFICGPVRSYKSGLAIFWASSKLFLLTLFYQLALSVEVAVLFGIHGN